MIFSILLVILVVQETESFIGKLPKLDSYISKKNRTIEPKQATSYLGSNYKKTSIISGRRTSTNRFTSTTQRTVSLRKVIANKSSNANSASNISNTHKIWKAHSNTSTEYITKGMNQHFSDQTVHIPLSVSSSNSFEEISSFEDSSSGESVSETKTIISTYQSKGKILENKNVKSPIKIDGSSEEIESDNSTQKKIVYKWSVSRPSTQTNTYSNESSTSQIPNLHSFSKYNNSYNVPTDELMKPIHNNFTESAYSTSSTIDVSSVHKNDETYLKPTEKKVITDSENLLSNVSIPQNKIKYTTNQTFLNINKQMAAPLDLIQGNSCEWKQIHVSEPIEKEIMEFSLTNGADGKITGNTHMTFDNTKIIKSSDTDITSNNHSDKKVTTNNSDLSENGHLSSVTSSKRKLIMKTQYENSSSKELIGFTLTSSSGKNNEMSEITSPNQNRTIILKTIKFPKNVFNHHYKHHLHTTLSRDSSETDAENSLNSDAEDVNTTIIRKYSVKKAQPLSIKSTITNIDYKITDIESDTSSHETFHGIEGKLGSEDISLHQSGPKIVKSAWNTIDKSKNDDTEQHHLHSNFFRSFSHESSGNNFISDINTLNNASKVMRKTNAVSEDQSGGTSQLSTISNKSHENDSGLSSIKFNEGGKLMNGNYAIYKNYSMIQSPALFNKTSSINTEHNIVEHEPSIFSQIHSVDKNHFVNVKNILPLVNNVSNKKIIKLSSKNLHIQDENQEKINEHLSETPQRTFENGHIMEITTTISTEKLGVTIPYKKNSTQITSNEQKIASTLILATGNDHALNNISAANELDKVDATTSSTTMLIAEDKDVNNTFTMNKNFSNIHSSPIFDENLPININSKTKVDEKSFRTSINVTVDSKDVLIDKSKTLDSKIINWIINSDELIEASTHNILSHEIVSKDYVSEKKASMSIAENQNNFKEITTITPPIGNAQNISDNNNVSVASQEGNSTIYTNHSILQLPLLHNKTTSNMNQQVTTSYSPLNTSQIYWKAGTPFSNYTNISVDVNNTFDPKIIKWTTETNNSHDGTIDKSKKYIPYLSKTISLGSHEKNVGLQTSTTISNEKKLNTTDPFIPIPYFIEKNTSEHQEISTISPSDDIGQNNEHLLHKITVSNIEDKDTPFSNKPTKLIIGQQLTLTNYPFNSSNLFTEFKAHDINTDNFSLHVNQLSEPKIIYWSTQNNSSNGQRLTESQNVSSDIHMTHPLQVPVTIRNDRKEISTDFPLIIPDQNDKSSVDKTMMTNNNNKLMNTITSTMKPNVENKEIGWQWTTYNGQTHPIYTKTSTNLDVSLGSYNNSMNSATNKINISDPKATNKYENQKSGSENNSNDRMNGAESTTIILDHSSINTDFVAQKTVHIISSTNSPEISIEKNIQLTTIAPENKDSMTTNMHKQFSTISNLFTSTERPIATTKYNWNLENSQVISKNFPHRTNHELATMQSSTNRSVNSIPLKITSQ